MSQGMTPEFVLAYRAMMLDGIAREAECTKRVIAAVPDANSDYKPDPHARTAKELAWHIAHSDIQFLDAIAEMKFDMSAAETKPETSAEVVGVVRREPEARSGARGGDDARAAHDSGGVLRRIQLARSVVSRLPQQSQRSSSGRTDDVSAADGIEGAFDLRRKLR